jgi:hypothetical protein
MDLSQYRLETLCQDGEFILYRGVMERPAPATIKKLEHELSFMPAAKHALEGRDLVRRASDAAY